jgi:hypothetical protein
MESTRAEEPKDQSAPWYIGLHDSGLMATGESDNLCAEGFRLAQTANVRLEFI